MADGSAFAKAIPLFTALDGAALDEVKAAAQMRRVGAGATFFREGDPASSFFVLDSGSVKLTQLTPEGHQVVLRLVGPGDAFGGVAAFGGGTYPITAEAVTDAAALEWLGSVMTRLMERHPRLALNALQFVASRLHELEVRYRQLATEKVERRVARALLRLVQQAGRPIEAGVLIDLPLSRDDIAQMTGTTLYTVSRIVSRFETDGLLEAGRQRVVIRDSKALARIADDLD
ncbi:MAG TPA: Crp/Fnr family transcriptional regulator [Vicinamibacterales bacterium]|nr:Crp/Fnr family transcriptional regulator [Vicinamibacterales bacterium]